MHETKWLNMAVVDILSLFCMYVHMCSAGDYVRSNEALIEAIRVRDEKLVATEHLAKKFLEVRNTDIFDDLLLWILKVICCVVIRLRMGTIG
jgi:hypothetical protein